MLINILINWSNYWSTLRAPDFRRSKSWSPIWSLVGWGRKGDQPQLVFLVTLFACTDLWTNSFHLHLAWVFQGDHLTPSFWLWPLVGRWGPLRIQQLISSWQMPKPLASRLPGRIIQNGQGKKVVVLLFGSEVAWGKMGSNDPPVETDWIARRAQLLSWMRVTQTSLTTCLRAWSRGVNPPFASWSFVWSFSFFPEC